MTDTTKQHRLTLSSVIPVWVIALVGAVLVVARADRAPFTWMLVLLVVCVLVSFALQLATQTKDGLVERISIASSGAFVIVLVATVVLALVR